jgi:hypothetical protein
MKRLLIVCGVLLTLISCQQQGDDNKQTIQVSKTSKVFSLADSLTKYQNADSLFEIGTQRYYVGTANETAFALVAISDSTTALYQKEGNDWFNTDTLSFLASAVTIIDLNGDNLKDVVMTYGVTGIGGNAENVSLLYYPATHKFKHNEYFDLPNISYDRKSSLIRSAWFSGVVHGQDKMTYTPVGDSVLFKEGVTYEPIEATKGATAIVEFYKMQGNNRLVIKKLKGNSEKMFNVFSKALWDTSNDY